MVSNCIIKFFSLAIWPITQAYPEIYKISLAVLKDKGMFKEGRFAANKDDQNNLVGTSGCQYLTSLSSITEFASSLEMDVLPLCGALLFPTLRSHGLQPPGSSVHGILQARILEWVAMPSSRGSSWPRDRTCVSCIGRQILYLWATWETRM